MQAGADARRDKARAASQGAAGWPEAGGVAPANRTGLVALAIRPGLVELLSELEPVASDAALSRLDAAAPDIPATAFRSAGSGALEFERELRAAIELVTGAAEEMISLTPRS